MDPFTAGVTITQAAGYFTSVVSVLLDVYQLVRKGGEILQHHRSDISDLIQIISTVNENQIDSPSTPLKHICTALETTSYRLLNLFREASKLKLIVTLLVRREEIDQNFTSLERHKSTLILYLTTQTSLKLNTIMAKNGRLSKKHYEDNSRGTRTPEVDLASMPQPPRRNVLPASSISPRHAPNGWARWMQRDMDRQAAEEPMQMIAHQYIPRESSTRADRSYTSPIMPTPSQSASAASSTRSPWGPGAFNNVAGKDSFQHIHKKGDVIGNRVGDDGNQLVGIPKHMEDYLKLMLQIKKVKSGPHIQVDQDHVTSSDETTKRQHPRRRRREGRQ